MRAVQAAMFLLSLAITACIPFGDAWFMFEGTVRDERGSPIPAAKLQILVNGKPAGERSVEVTDVEGKYKFFESSCPCDFEFQLVVTKAGYETFVYRARGRAANQLDRLDIILKQSHN